MRACEYKGDPGELFDGLAAMYQHLWPMRFGAEGDVSIDEDAFQARSGFGLAFHESKQTKRNPRLAKRRAVEYHGKTYDISPHIKDGDRKRGHLRIHFFSDSDERMVVIGHCGNHMETDGRRRTGRRSYEHIPVEYEGGICPCVRKDRTRFLS